MSRASLTCSVLALTSIFSSLASAARAVDPQFAQPPHVAPHADYPHAVPDYEIMPAPSLDRDTVRAALLVQRRANLARFRAYQRKGIFPNNTFSDRKLNVWRDADGNFCAAATMIKMSGQDDLVQKVADQTNFIRLADVSQGPLMDWILTSGLTQAEIAAIQEPFMPVGNDPNVPTVGGGAMPRPIYLDDPQVSVKLRQAEDARLRTKYKQVERMILMNWKRNLELSVDRLMKHPQLAWQLVNANAD
jgi:hypothetical protein